MSPLSLSYGIYRGNFVSSSPPFARALSEKICFRPPHDENTNSILEKCYFATGEFNKLTFLK
jgi:hypothetical protein